MTIEVPGLDGIYPLSVASDEQLRGFDCGKLSLNIWLEQRARNNELSGGSRTFILVAKDGSVAGYYSLANHCLAHEGTRAVLRRDMPDPIPAILLGRLAVSKNCQGLGIGRSLLRHAIENTRRASEITAAAIFLTEPIDEVASRFYPACGFARVGNSLPFLGIRLH